MRSEDPLPLGPPQPGCRVFVDTPEGLKTQGTGEIVLVGPQVAAEYWPKSHANNANFGSMGDQRSYHTGDHGHLDVDGAMTIKGRIDSQVKINGFRIELGEIERTAMQVPFVKVAVAMKAPPECNKGGLILIVNEDAFAQDQIEKVRTHLQRSLPPFMVPARIQAETDLPLSLAGKIDRKVMAQRLIFD